MKWNPDNCLIGTKNNEGVDHQCWFDLHSIIHFSYVSFFYVLLLFLVSLMKYLSSYDETVTRKTLIVCFWIINALHLIDDVCNNTLGWSLESIHYKGRQYDTDSIQNFTGDIASGFVGTCVVYWFLQHYNIEQTTHWLRLLGPALIVTFGVLMFFRHVRSEGL